jgi:FixJ family two-component response regulator
MLRLGRTGDCVLVLDTRPSEEMPAAHIVATLREFGSIIRTVVLADTSDDREVIECLRQGASDFLTYPVSPDDLLQTIYRLSVLPNVG